MSANQSNSGKDATCARCGRRRAGDPPTEALAWVTEFDNGRTIWTCPACARQHVRDIEGKLPSEYW